MTQTCYTQHENVTTTQRQEYADRGAPRSRTRPTDCSPPTSAQRSIDHRDVLQRPHRMPRKHLLERPMTEELGGRGHDRSATVSTARHIYAT